MNNWRMVTGAFLWGVFGSLATPKITVAQNQLVNPLEEKINSQDPLIPLGYGRRSLSRFEINRITREMVRLEQTAKTELLEGNGEKAFELLYRQLKLARVIGVETEVEALGNAGAIAWQENHSLDLRNIANRLIAIELATEESDLAPELWDKFAIAYQQVRYLEQAIAIQKKILARSKQQEDLVAITENLETLGELHFDRFNYPAAVQSYQELLALSESSALEQQVNSYLNILIDLYDRTGQKKVAIATRKRLIEKYAETEKPNQLEQLASLKLAIAHDYTALNQTQPAIQAYKEAFTLASANQQLAIAEEALHGLGKLQEKEGKRQQAIVTYTKLLKLQRQSYNDYGLINTYDSLGKISLKSAQKKQAKQYFEQALELAQALDYQVDYFKHQIKKLGQ